jgi:hypothetical protein
MIILVFGTLFITGIVCLVIATINSFKLVRILRQKGGETDFFGSTGGMKYQRYLKSKEFEQYGDEATEIGNRVIRLQNAAYGSIILAFCLAFVIQMAGA